MMANFFIGIKIKGIYCETQKQKRAAVCFGCSTVLYLQGAAVALFKIYSCNQF